MDEGLRLVYIVGIVVFCTIMGATTVFAMFMQGVWLRRLSDHTIDVARYQQEAYERFIEAHKKV